MYHICTTYRLLAHAFATFHPIVKGLQCDTNAIVVKEQHVHFHNFWTSTILRWAAQEQPHMSCVSWIVQILYELVILVWCAHVVYCLAESSGYKVLLGGYGDTSTQWANCRNNHQMLFAFKVILNQTWCIKNAVRWYWCQKIMLHRKCSRVTRRWVCM